MSKEARASWQEQPWLEVVAIWISVVLAFAVAVWQLGPALTGADISAAPPQVTPSDVHIASSDTTGTRPGR